MSPLWWSISPLFSSMSKKIVYGGVYAGSMLGLCLYMSLYVRSMLVYVSLCQSMSASMLLYVSIYVGLGCSMSYYTESRDGVFRGTGISRRGVFCGITVRTVQHDVV